MLWRGHYFETLWISGSFSLVASVNMPWQVAALLNRQSSCCERLSISVAAETSSTSFPRSRYSRALLLSLNAPNTTLAPDVCKDIARGAFMIGTRPAHCGIDRKDHTEPGLYT